jgi:hypothetical protein
MGNQGHNLKGEEGNALIVNSCSRSRRVVSGVWGSLNGQSFLSILIVIVIIVVVIQECVAIVIISFIRARELVTAT